MEILILNDGTEITGHCFEDGKNLFVYLDGLTVIQGVTLFSDPEKTKKIVAMNHGSKHTYKGYTEIYSASHEFGNCNLVMRKANSNA